MMPFNRLLTGLCLKCAAPLIHPFNDMQQCSACTKETVAQRKAFREKRANAKKMSKRHVIDAKNIMVQYRPIGHPDVE